MSRIACLHIPRFQTVVQQKHKQLKDELFYQTIQRNLVIDLISCSPRVKAQEPGIILLDASGLSLRGGENKFCHHVLKTCSLTGFTDAYISIADSAFAAMVVSRSTNRRIHIVPPGSDAKFLAPLSIEHLNLEPEIQDTLIVLGIKTMGQLANLPVAELNERFSKKGEIIWKPWELSQGIDSCQPTVPEPEKIFQCFLELGGATDSFNEIVFALKSMLDRLTTDLKQEGLLVQELVLSLYHETKKFDERTLELIRPTHEAKFLLEVIRLSLAAKTLERELTGIKLRVSRFTQEEWKQTNLDKLPTAKVPASKNIKNESTTSNKLTTAELLLLQRFNARLGKNKIFTAKSNDQYISENAGVWIPVTDQSIQQNILPMDMAYLKNKAQEQMIADLILRPTLPPPAVLVQLKDAKPAAINYKKRWYKIKSVSEPEYLSCQWWSKAIAKDYYKILVAPADLDPIKQNNQSLLLMLLTYDRLKNNWCIEGVYD